MYSKPEIALVRLIVNGVGSGGILGIELYHNVDDNRKLNKK